MKRFKLGAAIFCMLVIGSTAAYAQTSEPNSPRKADGQTQKVTEAFERLKSTLSNGGSEGAACAGDGVFTSLGDFTRPAGDDASAVRAPMSKSPRKTSLVKAAADCWEVCVSWGPLHVCYTWETRCR